MHELDEVTVTVVVTAVHESGRALPTRLTERQARFDYDSEAQAWLERLDRWLEQMPSLQGELRLWPRRREPDGQELEEILERMLRPERMAA